jgi:hypothetical protein
MTTELSGCLNGIKLLINVHDLREILTQRDSHQRALPIRRTSYPLFKILKQKLLIINGKKRLSTNHSKDKGNLNYS